MCRFPRSLLISSAQSCKEYRCTGFCMIWTILSIIMYFEACTRCYLYSYCYFSVSYVQCVLSSHASWTPLDALFGILRAWLGSRTSRTFFFLQTEFVCITSGRACTPWLVVSAHLLLFYTWMDGMQTRESKSENIIEGGVWSLVGSECLFCLFEMPPLRSLLALLDGAYLHFLPKDR